MNRSLASIQKIINIQQIEGADHIEVATVLGWKVVVRKGDFKIGEDIIFCEIDSLLPRASWSEFLWKKGDENKTTYRLRTCKLRGQISQGLVLPINILKGLKYANDERENPEYTFDIGKDVSELLCIVKYNPPISAQLAGQVKGTYPCFIPKTDETRAQAVPDVLKEIVGKEIYITTKADGSSCTMFYNRGEFGVCSRNLELKETEGNTLWELAKKYDVHNKLKSLNRNIALQGECIGEGIQKNRMGLVGHDWLVFDAYDIDKGEYLSYNELTSFSLQLGLNMVPLDTIMEVTKEWSIEEALEMAKGKYKDTNNNREGIVVRPIVECKSEALKGRLSFKIINQEYLLKESE